MGIARFCAVERLILIKNRKPGSRITHVEDVYRARISRACKVKCSFFRHWIVADDHDRTSRTGAGVLCNTRVRIRALRRREEG